MGKVKRLKIGDICFLGLLTTLFLLPSAAALADDSPAVIEEERAEPRSELDRLKGEWEAVREQQIEMIREKEDQLEKLKEDIFSKIKALDASAVPPSGASQAAGANAPEILSSGEEPAPVSSPELEAQKAAFKTERQKFFTEMNRQKENLLRLQSALNEKTKQLETERTRFEQEKNTAAR